MLQADNIRYSIILPIYNEEAVIPVLMLRLEQLLASLDAPAEVIFVNDGSTDTSAIFLSGMCKLRPNHRLINFSRNFGHQIAITAGLDAAQGEAIIVMDADLQDPPELVLEMIARWKEGYEIIHARRISREGETWFKRASANLFYLGLSRLAKVEIPRNVGDFRLIDRKVLEAFRAMPERDRFVRGMFAWLGFRTTYIDFHRAARVAGETKYPLVKMVRLALTGIIGFSDVPLRLAIWAGISVSGLAFMYGLYAIAEWFTAKGIASGWSSTVVIISFLCGMNMLMTGIVGLYIGRIYNEVKRRPLYIVDRKVGFDAANSDQTRHVA